jgi:Fe-S-cluster-containing hydrogenase component 2
MGSPSKIVVADESRCSGCQLCTLACSFFTRPGKAFNPSIARLRVERRDMQNRFRVRFLDDCIQCGKCSDYCSFGVFDRVSVEA